MATTDNFTFGSSDHPFELSFPFIDEDNLVVTLDGVEQQLGTDYTVINKTSNTAAGVGFLSGAQIQFTASPLPTTGAVKVVRNTTLETTSTFKTGSAIRAIDLNSNFTQNLYVTEEISNNAILTDGSNAFDGDLNMGGNQITNLGTPATDSDAVTKLYVDSRVGSSSIPGYTRWRTTATASQTVFSGVGESGGTLAYSATRENVYVNGALQQRTVDYTADNGTTITFIVGLQAGDIVDVVCVNNVSTVTSDQSSELYFLQSGTGATTRTVESKLKDVVSVKDFGATGDGVTDDTAAIQAAITKVSNSNNSLYFPAGTYQITTSLTVSGSCTLIGDGPGSSIISMTGPTGVSMLTINSKNVTVDSLKLIATVTSGVGSIVNITLGGSDVSGLYLNNLLIEGSLLSSVSATNAIKLNDATSANDCKLSNVRFKQHNFAFFTANNFGATGNKAKRWVITGCIFDTVKRGVSFNSDFATSGQTSAWEEVVVDSCHFVGATVDYDRTTVIGGDSCRRLVISNCTFRDRRGTDAVIHIENYMDDTIISNNVIYDCDGGIVVYPLTSRVIIDGNLVVLDPAATANPTAITARSLLDNSGITCLTDVDGQPSDVSITNNQVFGATSGCGLGLAANVTKISSISNNRVMRCVAGLSLRSDTSRSSLNNNTFIECGTGVELNTGATVIFQGGFKPTFIECANIITNFSTTSHPLILDSPIFIGEYSHTGSTTQAFTISPTPILNKGTCDIAVETLTGDNFYATTSDLVIDDIPTFTAARNGKISNGTVSVADPVMQDSSGDLQLRVFSSSANTIKYTVSFNGSVYYDL